MTEKWKRDTGILGGLVFLVLGIRFGEPYFFISLAFLLATLFVPALITPFAFAWLKLAEMLGLVMNKVFFGFVFFLVVTPVALLKKVFSDENPNNGFGRGDETAFHEPERAWSKENMQAPY